MPLQRCLEQRQTPVTFWCPLNAQRSSGAPVTAANAIPPMLDLWMLGCDGSGWHRWSPRPRRPPAGFVNQASARFARVVSRSVVAGHRRRGSLWQSWRQPANRTAIRADTSNTKGCQRGQREPMAGNGAAVIAPTSVAAATTTAQHATVNADTPQTRWCALSAPTWRPPPSRQPVMDTGGPRAPVGRATVTEYGGDNVPT